MSRYQCKCIGCGNIFTLICQNCRKSDFKYHFQKIRNNTRNKEPHNWFECLNCGRTQPGGGGGVEIHSGGSLFGHCSTYTDSDKFPSNFFLEEDSPKERLELSDWILIISFILICSLIFYFVDF